MSSLEPVRIDPEAAPVAADTAWREGYQSVPGSFDEMLAADGTLHPRWQTFATQLDQLKPAELARRWEQGRQLIHENGVTYNVYGDPRGMDRPWVLDSLPRLISAEEWEELEAGLQQRARLLNMLLTDLYGPQALLRAGVLPPEMVFAHPGFLRPCHGIRVPHQLFLSLYASDVARMPDGSWAVIGDRTQAPSGAGYALENRLVLARILPDVFRKCQVHRMAHFFRKLRENLVRLAPHNRDNPRIVLLTPGPSNETYFEHAYLARYLNYILVEGGDLTVRDQCVYLKTLGGLQRVDVVLRRMDSDYCDPLELHPESALGVPGLMQAARAGNVAVANALGSGVIETPAMNCFLPQLCRYLLSEELLLPSVDTYWCGKPQALQHAVANLDHMVIKPAFSTREFEPVFGARLTQAQRQELIARMRSRPHHFVAQERIALSTVPVLANKRIQARHAVLRAFVTAHADGYSVMPGGLTQVPSSSDTLVFSLQRGGGSKDTWVQSTGPVGNFSLLRAEDNPVELTRGGSELPSRVADNMYWLGRYVERAECAVRLLRSIVVRLTEKSATGDVRELPDLIRALRYQRSSRDALDWDPIEDIGTKDELAYVIEKSRRPGGLYDTLKAMQKVARMVRDRLSIDTWRVIRSLDEEVVCPKPDRDVHLSEVLASLNYMIITLASFGGLASESMTRSQLWRFLDIGRRLERGIGIAALLRSTLVHEIPDDGPLLEAVLEVADSLMTYRRRYLSTLQVAPVLDLLIADETNPRSLAYQLLALSDHVERLPRERVMPDLSPEQRITVASTATVRLLDIAGLTEATDGTREALDRVTARIETDLGALSELITRDYLSHAQPSRHIVSLRPEQHE